MRTRYLFSLGVGVLVAAISGLSLWRAKTLMERDLGILTAQVDSIESGWEANKTPLSSRVVTILLSDVRASFDPFLIIATESEDGLIETSGNWINRNLIGGNSATQTPTALVRAFADSTHLISWTHNGFTAVSETVMSRELEKAILKAHDAGAEINIIAQGADAAPVLMALMRVNGLERGGLKVGANKVILLGVNASRIKRIPSVGADFGKPGSVFELANVWSTRESGSNIQMQVFDGERKGETLDMRVVWPDRVKQDDSADKSLRLLREYIESTSTLGPLISQQEMLQRDERERKAAEEEARTKAVAAADMQEKVRARAAAANNARKIARTGTPATGIARAERAARGAPAGPNNWPSASIMDYAPTMDGKDIGWLVSAPADILKELTRERTAVTLPIDVGLSNSGCSAHLELNAISTDKLGPGEHDAAIQTLYETRANIGYQPLLGKISKQRVYGYPASIFKTARGADGNYLQAVERTYLVIESKQHLIYLFLWTAYTKENHDTCLNSHMHLYQKIAESIRPDTSAR